MGRAAFPTFGQELYLRETVEAARLLDREGLTKDAAARIAGILPHPSPITRRRLANKILQRLEAGCAEPAQLRLFVRLLANLEESEARRELVYYSASRADPIVGAIASEILYPFFIERTLPAGTAPEEASPEQEGLLLTVERMVMLRFILRYAEQRWQYRSERSIRLAMRIMQHGGIVLPQRLRGARGRVTGYILAPHGISLPAFVWCCMTELPALMPRASVDAILTSGFVRRLIVPPAIVEARLQQAERAGYLRFQSGGFVGPGLPMEEVIERLAEARTG